MTWRTHLVGGISSLWSLSLLPNGLSAGTNTANVGLLALVAGLGALLLDLDAGESHLKHLTLGAGIKPLYLPARFLHRTLGHRGLLHSLFGLALAMLLVGVPVGLLLNGWLPTAALALGYASHLLLDACTKRGIPLWFPHHRLVHLLPPPLRVRTGSPAEEVVLALLGVLAAALLLTITVHGTGGVV